jgi:hypothetical protein
VVRKEKWKNQYLVTGPSCAKLGELQVGVTKAEVEQRGELRRQSDGQMANE